MARLTSRKPALDDTSAPVNLVFKGYRSGLMLIIPEAEPFELILSELKKRLDESNDFFKGAQISFQIGARKLTTPERGQIFEIVNQFGLIPQRFSDEPEFPKTTAPRDVNNDEANFVATITVKKTVRSGQRVEFEGNLVIVGDVNPGAEIVASGDIFVLGKLRGTAHAGVNGNQAAQVLALQLKPVQLRIAGVITRAPEEETGRRRRYTGPEIALIKDGRIVVEPFAVK